MAFAGTTQKCKACEKTVYLVDQLTADNRIYHKACFRCHHCKSTLKNKMEKKDSCSRPQVIGTQGLVWFGLGNFNSFEGVLYCRPHFDQLFKRTGSLDKSFQDTPKVLKPERAIDESKGVAHKFAGTREKCVGCKKTVYPIEKVTVDASVYHRSCFKCTYGGCTISPSSYIAHEGKLYCKHHHIQLFKEKGNYSQLENDKESGTAPEVASQA